MLKPTFLHKIFMLRMAGTHIDKICELARLSQYPMFEFNGIVYSTEHYWICSNAGSNDSKAELFHYSDLVNN